MGSDKSVDEMFFSRVKEIKEFGEPCWWLSIYSCSACEQKWLVAQEERMNDIYILKRIKISGKDFNFVTLCLLPI